MTYQHGMLVLCLDISVFVVNESACACCAHGNGGLQLPAGQLCCVGTEEKGAERKFWGPVVTEPVGLAASYAATCALQFKGVKLPRLSSGLQLCSLDMSGPCEQTSKAGLNITELHSFQSFYFVIHI